MKVDLIATRNSPYGGKIKKGDRRRVSERDAKILIALGHATPAPKVETPPAGEYMRRDMTAQRRSYTKRSSKY